MDEQRVIADGKINLIGMAHMGPKHPVPEALPE